MMSPDAQAKLEEMSLDERIAAVAADVASKRDEYRSIKSYELAELLGITDAEQPAGDWGFTSYVEPREIQDMLEEGDEEYVPDLIKPHVTPERYEELKSKFLSATEISSRPENLNFLTEAEKQTIIRCDMEYRARNENNVLAQRSIEAPNGINDKWEAPRKATA